MECIIDPLFLGTITVCDYVETGLIATEGGKYTFVLRGGQRGVLKICVTLAIGDVLKFKAKKLNEQMFYEFYVLSPTGAKITPALPNDGWSVQTEICFKPKSGLL